MSESNQDGCDWMSPEELAESVWGSDWRKHPDYLKARQWVLDNFYDDAKTASEDQYSESMMKLGYRKGSVGDDSA